MDLRDLDGAIPSFLGAAPGRRAIASDGLSQRDALQRRLTELIDGRRELGGPLPASSADWSKSATVSAR
jgi:hypothetical protein